MSFLRNNLKFVPRLQLFRKFSSEKPWQEVSIPVPWGQIRGKWWGSTDVRPILTLHGWQDNAGTWDRLIPLLNQNVGFLAIDLPGHGFSSNLPPGTFYHFTSYLLVIKYIVKYFGWSKIALMGHSLGGIFSYTYTMLYPESVDFVVCIDGLKPLIRKGEIKHISESMDTFLVNNKFAVSTTEPPSYSLEEIKKKIHVPNNGSVHLECAHYLMKRNIAPSKKHPGKYYFTRDPRLKSQNLVFFSQENLVENAWDVTCPILAFKCKGANYFEKNKESFYEVLDVLKRSSSDCEYHYIEGTHHTHLNNPGHELAGLINNFVPKYYDENQCNIKQKCFVTEEHDLEIKAHS